MDMATLGQIEIRDGRIALRDFQLVVGNWMTQPGLTSVVGPNGSGKSTFLRTVLGINVLTAGERISSISDTRLGYVPQNYRQALIPWTTCEANMSLFKGVDTKAALLALETLGFNSTDFGKRPSQLSGGQCQRIAIVRELALAPAVLVLDEPFSSLDTRSVAIASEAIANFIDGGGIAIVASHQAYETPLRSRITNELCIRRSSDTIAEIQSCPA